MFDNILRTSIDIPPLFYTPIKNFLEVDPEWNFSNNTILRIYISHMLSNQLSEIFDLDLKDIFFRNKAINKEFLIYLSDIISIGGISPSKINGILHRIINITFNNNGTYFEICIHEAQASFKDRKELSITMLNPYAQESILTSLIDQDLYKLNTSNDNYFIFNSSQKNNYKIYRLIEEQDEIISSFQAKHLLIEKYNCIEAEWVLWSVNLLTPLSSQKPNQLDPTEFSKFKHSGYMIPPYIEEDSKTKYILINYFMHTTFVEKFFLLEEVRSFVPSFRLISYKHLLERNLWINNKDNLNDIRNIIHKHANLGNITCMYVHDEIEELVSDYYLQKVVILSPDAEYWLTNKHNIENEKIYFIKEEIEEIEKQENYTIQSKIIVSSATNRTQKPLSYEKALETILDYIMQNDQILIQELSTFKTIEKNITDKEFIGLIIYPLFELNGMWVKIKSRITQDKSNSEKIARRKKNILRVIYPNLYNKFNRAKQKIEKILIKL
ncbi:hypothetical protein [Rickettsiales endosymbiont of Stachyamoeba lipophora]|uniref:hypothetical protein n=1 Tax=Rickettsiales endosymbiont of Stachyamoeba lipophora TaxID=2486578 RepID=UPI000F648A8A|nr:hypothetical protein [Rickettsiales endosymbiont of Stachyamoeba lipophora]AZL16319.1 hypothetical protein EF513_07255 [Rickettsiales endosymbiont of Stachyamoeba lipophora]